MSYLNQLQPLDESNLVLQASVHPHDWRNPVPTGRYNLVVIGAGTAGLVTAAAAAGLGAKVALVERGLMGGDCLNVGCVPSKAIISSGRFAASLRRADELGISLTAHPEIRFAEVKQRMRKLRARISPHDSAARFRQLGVDVYFGDASIVDSSTIDVHGTKLQFKRAVIATGARAAVPNIPGLENVPYLTNESLFSLTELPKHLGVIGAGPIGCEMAQTFAQLGSTVHLFESGSGVLPREDRDAADIVKNAMVRDGVTLHWATKDLVVGREEAIRIVFSNASHLVELAVDQLLISTGRTPNVEGLNLESVGVATGSHGIEVNDYLRTTNPRIYAAGDVCSPYQFTHAADFMARIVVQNALFMGRRKLSSLVVPWCTYTSPEIAHVGLYPHQAQQRGLEIDTYTQHFRDVDRALLEGEETGFAKVHVRKGTDQIVGATIVANSAGDLISEITLAMTNGLGLSKIGRTIHPYPTRADAIRRLGDQYSRTRLTPMVKSLFQKWLSWTR